LPKSSSPPSGFPLMTMSGTRPDEETPESIIGQEGSGQARRAGEAD
jgi:hypothetical protein